MAQEFWSRSSAEDLKIKLYKLFQDDPFCNCPLLVGEGGWESYGAFIQSKKIKKWNASIFFWDKRVKSFWQALILEQYISTALILNRGISV